MSKTIEEIKEDRAQECLARNWSQLLVVGLTNTDVDYIAERYAKSKTQELQEQNAELVGIIYTMVDEFENTSKSSSDILMDGLKKTKEILTRHNHLKSKTNG